MLNINYKDALDKKIGHVITTRPTLTTNIISVNPCI